MTDGQRSPPGDSFLARRARLKMDRQRAARESASPADQAVDVANETTEAAEATAPPPAPALTDADMPPVESLTAESDFTMFLSEGVSDVLRRAALRKLFHLPEFNILDGLNDYDEDYTKFEKLGDVVTYHQRRMQARDEAAKKAAAEKEAGGFSEPDEEEVTSEKAAANEPAETGDVEDAPGSRQSVTVGENEELEDDGDLES